LLFQSYLKRMKNETYRPAEIASDISQASTLESNTYISKTVFEIERRRVFATSWNLVAHRHEIDQNGTVLPFQLAGESLLLARGKDGVLRAMSNVCRHRAGPLVEACGPTNFLRCKYHAWTYDLQGQLLNTPEFDGVADFEKSKVRLPQWQVREWGPFIFVSRNPAATFEEYIGEVPEILENSLPGLMDRLSYVNRKDYHVDSNWKVYVDNYLEGYHIGPVHPELARELDYPRYKTVVHDWYSEQIAPAKETGQLYNSGDHPGAHYFWFFPNLMFNIYQGLFQTNVVIPTGTDTCIVRFEWYRDSEATGPSASSKWSDLTGFSDLVQEQDAHICAKVQQNLNSMDYNRGRFSVARENGVHHFHRLWTRLMTDTP
jgi:choline monooxygenase